MFKFRARGPGLSRMQVLMFGGVSALNDRGARESGEEGARLESFRAVKVEVLRGGVETWMFVKSRARHCQQRALGFSAVGDL